MNNCLSCAITTMDDMIEAAELKHLFHHDNLPPVLKVSDTLTPSSAAEDPAANRQSSEDGVAAPAPPGPEQAVPEASSLPVDLEPSQARCLLCVVRKQIANVDFIAAGAVAGSCCEPACHVRDVVPALRPRPSSRSEDRSPRTR